MGRKSIAKSTTLVSKILIKKVKVPNILWEDDFSIIILTDKELITRLYVLKFYKSVKTIPSPNGNRIQIGIITEDK